MRGLEAVGLDPESELRRAGVALVDGVVRTSVSRAAYQALWTRMARAAAQDDVGLFVAERIDPGTVGALEWFATSASTLGAGFDALASCGRLLHTGGQYVLDRRRDEVAFVYYSGSERRPFRPLLDWAIGYLLRAVRRVTAGAVTPREVRLQYARPASAARVEDAFGAPVRFDQPLNEVVFTREQLDTPLVTHDPEAHAALEALCRARCAGARPEGLACRVRRALLTHLSREELPTLESVARSLGMSGRSLQRGLTNGGSSFRQLVLEARMETAERWLADPRKTIAEVAYGLGYSEPSPFHRAYRAYFGRACRADPLTA